MKNNITPLSVKEDTILKQAMDMETMKINQYGDQIPVLISFVSNNIREVILIDHTKFVYLENGELDMACIISYWNVCKVLKLIKISSLVL